MMLLQRVSTAQHPRRKTYEESCRRLWSIFLEHGIIPALPEALPRPDGSSDQGVAFFRTFIGESDDFSNLTLPRTFFAETEIRSASFANSDFSESNFCYNDWVAVDFSSANLKGSDLRCSLFGGVNFAYANLSSADLRHSEFENCDFTDSLMEGTILTRSQGLRLDLSKSQRAVIHWCWTAGKLPPGG